MTIRNKGGSSSPNRRKADQHWDLAGMARRDGDKADEERHTKLAREYGQKFREEG